MTWPDVVLSLGMAAILFAFLLGMMWINRRD